MIDLSFNTDGSKLFQNLADKVFEKLTDSLGKAQTRLQENANEKAERIREYRKEASRMASMANKRLNRLEENDLKDSPAYRGYLEKGGKRFSVRGKTYNQVQAEVARMKAFIDANTSTVRGVNNYLKEIAANTGIQYKNLSELREKAPKFFELASKVEQYLRDVEDMASAIGYEKIWESINVYVEQNKIDLRSSENDVDKMIEDITQAIKEFEKPEYVNLNDIDGFNGGTWYNLPKE